MKKIILSVILAASLFGIEYGDEKMDSWRGGFITAYKAMEVDTQQQGLESKPMDTKRYVIYFDAKGDDIAIWDKLMVQMFGYSASVHKPIRTTKDWIIFASYDNKATALQELDILNDKIFKNSKQYKLKFFDNDKNEIFYNDKALLTSQLKELEGLLKMASEQKLKVKQKELEENQKVALVYVDKASGEQVPKPETLASEKSRVKSEEFTTASLRETPQLNDGREPSSVKSESAGKSVSVATSSTSAHNTSAVRSETAKEQKTVKDKTVFEPHEGYVKQARDDIMFFSRTVLDAKYKVRTAKKGEIVAVESKNGLNWYKVKGEELYIAGHLAVPASEAEYQKSLKAPVAAEAKKESHKAVLKESVVGSLAITAESVVVYKLKNPFDLAKTKYPLADFEVAGVLDNDYKKTYQYSAIVEDSDGVKYVKLFGENTFIAYSNVFLM